ncbi:MAG: cupin domain-containing protein [Campylobacterota bacterium]
MIRPSNLFEGPVPPENGEVFTPVFETSGLRIEAIRSRLKTPGEWYDQVENEWVMLVCGEAMLEIAGEVLRLRGGDHLLIPARTPHRVLSTAQDTYWIGVFSS